MISIFLEDDLSVKMALLMEEEGNNLLEGGKKKKELE